ncbi:hypothetical protein TVAG_391140 [Trichomonas vaginalis G3]|uniref:Uncharacterized protein n=1 Tax=Trichomonas vaginalis (strain ATCC PRA-98 / G3) TaxID=412133 RepID=A2DFM7_TRIV3|nr:spectrin binding [Trichomonas vaginalis G3]EAY20730.1 hypothetical protein TVAG_391140 [Trichomonas vaginalis G3]KAI5529495.1 spectrin binding [Trichomonas vaginalis G3]|eukprot:XP_001581716.1 hypothetical protein [Trichomonas vaginalis G3]
MSQCITPNFEYIGSHINDYIQNDNFFDIFDLECSNTIMKHAKLTTTQFISLLKQSTSTLKASKLYRYIRNANVTIQSIDEVFSVLKSVKTYMKMKIFDGIIDFLKLNGTEMRNSSEEIEEPQEQVQILNNTENQAQEDSKLSQNLLTKISSLKKYNCFYNVYKFFEELCPEGDQEIISKSCEEGLLEKTTKDGKNVLHVACQKGNLKLVKSLMEAGCDKEAKDKYGYTPLILASREGQLEVVQYLISAGAFKEAKNNDGFTPLNYASQRLHFEVVKYLISVGANKETKDIYGYSPLIRASINGNLELVQYLISVGADKEAKDNDGYTPLIEASKYGRLEVVKYLISAGANKEAMDNGGNTVLSFVENINVRDYLISIGAK